jgi:hypothetical protein
MAYLLLRKKKHHTQSDRRASQSQIDIEMKSAETERERLCAVYGWNRGEK